VSKWSIATTIAGVLLGVNPFDEPNVQESKDRTKALLAHYTQARSFPQEAPLCAEGAVLLFDASRPGVIPRSVTQGLSFWLQRGQPSDYLAILSFWPRNSVLDDAAQTIRTRLSRATGRATMLGFGPRYLHSTGQLFKGGPDAALFLLLTADDPIDLPIPGEPYTFSVLKQAQALGDFQAMQQKGRRVLRVHLSGDLARSLQEFLVSVDDAAMAIAAARR
jgi:hypothetical protein